MWSRFRARVQKRTGPTRKKSENRVGPTWRKSENRDCRERVNYLCSISKKTGFLIFQDRNVPVPVQNTVELT